MKSRFKSFIFIVVLLLNIFVNSSVAFAALVGEEALPYKGDGSALNPNVYISSATSKVTWKHLNDVKSKSLYEEYEIREGDNQAGKLKYSWLFSYKDITVPEGPYFLGINFYDGDIVNGLPGDQDCLYFSFAHKRDLPGKAKVTLSVPSEFSNATKLYLYYYGGYNSTVVHGDSPIIMPNEIQSIDKLKLISSNVVVSNGYVKFDISYGGNYFLSKKEIAISSNAPANSPTVTNTTSNANSTAPVATNKPQVTTKTNTSSSIDRRNPSLSSNIDISKPTKINELFLNQNIAKAIAGYLGRSIDSQINQDDISGIKKLYLDSMELENISEIGKQNFERLESLIISNNKLLEIEKLSMPMIIYLDASFNKLQSIGNILSLTGLENVNLSNNDISAIPDLSELINLQTLNLSNNQLTAFPMLKSKTLRYIDLSNNNLIRSIDLINCTSLEDISITGQSKTISGVISLDNKYKLNPIPELITQFGNDIGTVQVYNSSDKLIDEISFAKMKENDYSLDFSKYENSSQFKVVVTGYYGAKNQSEIKNAEVLGKYTYTLNGNNISVKNNGASIWIVIIVVASLVVAVLIFIKKRVNNKHKNLSKN